MTRILCALVLCGIAAGQAKRAEPPKPPEPPDGKGISVRVSVVDADTGTGLADAAVSLFPEPRVNLRDTWLYQAATGSSGLAQFTRVVPNSYVLNVSLYGYTLAETAATRLGRLDEDKQLTVRMRKSASLECTVEDPDGVPVTDAFVSLLAEEWVGGYRTFREERRVPMKNGKIVVSSIPEGTYYLRAIETAPGARTASSLVTDVPQQGEVLIPTFYPSTTSLAAAVPVYVGPGAKLTGLIIEMQRSKLYRVTGRVEGMPPGIRSPGMSLAELAGYDSPLPMVGNNPNNLAPFSFVSDDGSFLLENVRPGIYNAVFSPGVEVRGGVRIEVRDRDIEDLRIGLSPGLAINGKVVYDDGSPAAELRADIQSFDPILGPRAGAIRFSGEPGAFQGSALSAGTWRVSFRNAAAVRSVQIDGRTFEGGEFELFAGGQGETIITLARNAASIGVAVEMDEALQDRPRGTVTLTHIPSKPTDQVRRQTLGANSSFSFTNVEQGEYRVCAWVEEGAALNRVVGNPRLENRLASSCETVEVGWTGSEQVRVKQLRAAEFQ